MMTGPYNILQPSQSSQTFSLNSLTIVMAPVVTNSIVLLNSFGGLFEIIKLLPVATISSIIIRITSVSAVASAIASAIASAVIWATECGADQQSRQERSVAFSSSVGCNRIV